MLDLDTIRSVWGVTVLAGVAIIALGVFGGWILKLRLRRFLDSIGRESGLELFLVDLLYYAVVIGASLSGLSTMGANLGPLIAGLGLGGFALGFALKDSLSNLIAGVLILLFRPFSVADNLAVAGCEGVVREINMRYTVLTNETETQMVPNSVIFTNPLRIKDR